MPLLCAVDGGGSRLRLWLSTPDGARIGRSEVGPANPHDVGWEGLGRALQEAHEGARRELGSSQPIATAVLGLAGVATPAERERCESLLRSLTWLGDAALHIYTDVEIAWHSAFHAEAGIVLIAGTGSIAYGRDGGGQAARVGGHGPNLDDAGSATWIGRAALAAVARASDGRGPPTPLTQALPRELDLASFDELRARLRAAPLPRSELARLARPVGHAAAAGDPVALALARAAADELALLVRTLSDRLSLPAPHVALQGGLLEHESPLTSILHAALDRILPTWQERPTPSPPITGALRLAASTER